MTEDIENLPDAPSRYARLRKPLLALGGLAVFLLLVGQVMPRLFPAHRTEPAAQHEAEAEDSGRIDRLEARIKALENAPKPTADNGVADAKIEALQAQVDSLQQKLEHPVVSAADSQRSASLEATVQALKAQVGDMQTRQKNQLLALAAFTPLEDAVLRGEPFVAEINQLASLTQGNSKAQTLLVELAHDDEQGTPTLAALQGLFEASVPKALAQGHPGALAHELQSLIRIRKVGDQPGGDDEAVIARAEAALSRGEVDAAAKELATLSATAAKAMESWITKAQLFVNIRHTLDALQLALVEDRSGLMPEPVPVPAKKPAAVPPVPDKAHDNTDEPQEP